MILENVVINNLFEKFYNMEYKIIEDENNLIRIKRENIRISAYDNLRDGIIDFSIRFLKENKVFDIGWMYVIEHNNSPQAKNKVECLKKLIDFAYDNYDKITNIEYCEMIDTKISEFIRNKK